MRRRKRDGKEEMGRRDRKWTDTHAAGREVDVDREEGKSRERGSGKKLG